MIARSWERPFMDVLEQLFELQLSSVFTVLHLALSGQPPNDSRRRLVIEDAAEVADAFGMMLFTTLSGDFDDADVRLRRSYINRLSA